MNERVGDKLRLYSNNGDVYKETTIVERFVGDRLFYDTMDSLVEYDNTYPIYTSIEDLVNSYRQVWTYGLERVEILHMYNFKERWSDLLSGDTLWLTKCELDEVLINVKELNINTLMIQSCKDKFVVKVDELTVKEHNKQKDIELNISLINNSTISFEPNTRGLRSKTKGIDIL